MSELQTKSKHGGRRAGAGRKPNPDSIRSMSVGCKSKYYCEINAYISEHAHPLLLILRSPAENKERLPEPGESRKTMMPLHLIYRLAHLNQREQLVRLTTVYRPIVDQFIREYDSGGIVLGKFCEAFQKLLEIKPPMTNKKLNAFSKVLAQITSTQKQAIGVKNENNA